MATVGERLRAKLPEVLFEAVSIVFAVLLALAVDEWRDDRAQRQAAERARQAILAEVRTNQDQLRRVLERNARWRQQIVDTLADPCGIPDGMKPSMSWAQLSSAAWRTAQSTQAAQRFDYGWLISVAQLYEGQALFEGTQAQYFTESGLSFMNGTTRPGLETLRDRLGYLDKLGSQVMAVYDSFLGGKPGTPVK